MPIRLHRLPDVVIGKNRLMLSNSVNHKTHVLIGKIVGAHGIKGTSKFYSYAESLALFEAGSTVWICDRHGREAAYEIKWIKPHGRAALISLSGVDDRRQAESLVGAEMFIEKARLPEPAPGTYYWFDLIGMEVYSTAENYLGRLTAVIPTSGNDIYVVKNGEKEVLVPALESVVRDIDCERRRMQVDLPEGLGPKV